MESVVTLSVAFQASPTTELRTAVGYLVQELTEICILVEDGENQWRVVRAAELAWLPSCKTLEEVEKYFKPAYLLNADNLTDEEINAEVMKRPDEVALIQRDGCIEQVKTICDDDKGPPSVTVNNVLTVRCPSCNRKVTIVKPLKLCPQCSNPFPKEE